MKQDRKKKNPKILHVINLFGSAENFIGGQFLYLKQEGYDMHLICSPDPRLHEFCSQQACSPSPVVIERQISPKKDLKALIHIYKYIKKNKINTVICHQAKGVLLGVVAAKLACVKNIIILEHGALYETLKGKMRKIVIWEYKFVSHLAKKIICVSPYVLELGIKNKTSKPEKRMLLGSGSCGGIDTINFFNPKLINKSDIIELKKRYSISEDQIIIGFVGRLVRDKGVVELLEGFKSLKSKFQDKNIRLLIVGSPEKRDGLSEDILNELNSNPDIVFTGKFPRSEMPKLYSLMDILVLPSYREGLPTCNLEAQAMEIPVITTKVSGTRDSIINGKTGLYCDLNGEDIANQVEKLFDVDIREKFGKAGREWVSENFDHTKVWPHMKSLLDSLTRMN